MNGAMNLPINVSQSSTASSGSNRSYSFQNSNGSISFTYRYKSIFMPRAGNWFKAKANRKLVVADGTGTDNDSPAAVFHKFPELPVEVRIKIWGFANNQPRIIICEASHVTKLRGSKSSRPSTFFANVESREEAKKAYLQLIIPGLSRPIDFNSRSDILFLHNKEHYGWWALNPFSDGTRYLEFDMEWTNVWVSTLLLCRLT